MSLKALHLVLLGFAVLGLMLFGAWALGGVIQAQDAEASVSRVKYLMLCLGALGLGGALIYRGVRFAILVKEVRWL